jgi:hypothetical protein
MVRVSLACEAQLGDRSSSTVEPKLDPFGDRVHHHKIYRPEVADPIYKPSSESDSDSDREVFMVG